MFQFQFAFFKSENDLSVTFYFIKCTSLDSTSVLRSKRKRGLTIRLAMQRLEWIASGQEPVQYVLTDLCGTTNKPTGNSCDQQSKRWIRTKPASQRNTSNLNEPYHCVFPVVNFANFLAKRSMTNTASDFFI